MPDIEIKNETKDVLRMSLTFGVELFCENVETGSAFKADVPSVRIVTRFCPCFAAHKSDEPYYKVTIHI